MGRHLVKKLLERGDSIYIIDDLSTGKHPDVWLEKKWQKKTQNNEEIVYSLDRQTVTFLLADALQVFVGLVNKAVKTSLPDFGDVFHLASIVGGRALIDGDPLMVAKDLAIDASFFLWATRFPQKSERILYASSSAAYPVDLQTKETALALKEEHIKLTGQMGKPDMTYGWSKLTGEYLAKLAHEKYGLHVACVRPFSGYGEDQDLSYPFPAIARRVANHENPIEVWGTGNQGRDFVHIDDCIDAMLEILQKVNDGRGINIGSGKLTSFNELIKLLCQIEGFSAEIKPLLDKPVGVQSRYADTTVLNTEIGWFPKISLADGAARVLQYAKKELKSV